MKSNSHSGRSGSTTVARISLALTCAIALGGCSTVKGWFGDKKGDDKPNEPLALTDITPTVVVSKLWSANAGKGEGRMGVGQRPAVADGRVYAAAVEGGVRAFDLQTGKLVSRVNDQGLHVELSDEARELLGTLGFVITLLLWPFV